MQYLLRKQETELKKMVKQKTKTLSKEKNILVDAVDYSTPSSSERLSSHHEHKSAKALMQSGNSVPQTTKSIDISGHPLTTFQSVQHLAQAQMTILSQNTRKWQQLG
ncbi:uncharacterized protein LOC110835447 [Zootermopsis nevadensis]|uniref:Uncharacterized protein n=1 Tax=Zootermopsis nevadensis TaxID=136037 RepID=A0A067QVY1_ZOONE|nr:uncharacterized protein LOC110835447 [Zootermopsis nevadensis]KDR13363.1 hypothetical protein L798_12587 [Zootermopsis nevadensis]